MTSNRQAPTERRKVVLVVEDEPILRMTAVDMVEVFGVIASETK